MGKLYKPLFFFAFSSINLNDGFEILLIGAISLAISSILIEFLILYDLIINNQIAIVVVLSLKKFREPSSLFLSIKSVDNFMQT